LCLAPVLTVLPHVRRAGVASGAGLQPRRDRPRWSGAILTRRVRRL
jgi:hypothetical protein